MFPVLIFMLSKPTCIQHIARDFVLEFYKAAANYNRIRESPLGKKAHLHGDALRPAVLDL